jgi:hypothetical protein
MATITKISGRYTGYSTLSIPIGRTPDEQHAHEPTCRELHAGQVYNLTYKGCPLRLEIVRFVHHLVEFKVWGTHRGRRVSFGRAALPQRWVLHALDHRAAQLAH